MKSGSELTTLVSLTDYELVHLRLLLSEENERCAKVAPPHDAMVAALREKLEETPSAFFTTHAPSAAFEGQETNHKWILLFLALLVVGSIALNAVT